MPEPIHHSGNAVALIAGRYELVREVGTHADVLDWEGFDSALQRRVLVQLVRPELAADAGVAERFWQAARSAARSSKQTGKRILDGGTDPQTGRAFVVREWPAQPPTIEGDTVVFQTSPPRSERFKTRRFVLLGLIIFAVVGVWAFRSTAEGWLAWVNAPLGQVSRSVLPSPVTEPTTQLKATPPPAAVATPPATVATPRATATPGSNAGVPRRIVNTDGRGVALRATPGGDRLPGKGYDEGVTVTAFESTGEWTRIRGSDGREGWILSVTLAA
jgi:SH3-like domain-containing protein